LDTLAIATQSPLSPISDDPDFRHAIKNVTVPMGREAVLACSVTDLGHYKVSAFLVTYGLCKLKKIKIKYQY